MTDPEASIGCSRKQATLRFQYGIYSPRHLAQSAHLGAYLHPRTAAPLVYSFIPCASVLSASDVLLASGLPLELFLRLLEGLRVGHQLKAGQASPWPDDVPSAQCPCA